MKLNGLRVVIALRQENWAVDQKIAGFNPKISSTILAGNLNKSNGAVKRPQRKVLLTPQLLRNQQDQDGAGQSLHMAECEFCRKLQQEKLFSG